MMKAHNRLNDFLDKGRYWRGGMARCCYCDPNTNRGLLGIPIQIVRHNPVTDEKLAITRGVLALTVQLSRHRQRHLFQLFA